MYFKWALEAAGRAVVSVMDLESYLDSWSEIGRDSFSVDIADASAHVGMR